ncbi:hypothetical protein HPULCUR_003883 [Helicostylum pulchrum]|uniref:Uncharacterized protein n=1 Tax=Helicostylum pulchrum TaxID=562976 RepID=A0ABP9XUL6_9FUNG
MIEEPGMIAYDYVRIRGRFIFPGEGEDGRFEAYLDRLQQWIHRNGFHPLSCLIDNETILFFQQQPTESLSRKILVELFSVDRDTRLKELLRCLSYDLNDANAAQLAASIVILMSTYFGIRAVDDGQDFFNDVPLLMYQSLCSSRNLFLCDFMLHYLTTPASAGEIISKYDLNKLLRIDASAVDTSIANLLNQTFMKPIETKRFGFPKLFDRRNYISLGFLERHAENVLRDIRLFQTILTNLPERNDENDGNNGNNNGDDNDDDNNNDDNNNDDNNNDDNNNDDNNNDDNNNDDNNNDDNNNGDNNNGGNNNGDNNNGDDDNGESYDDVEKRRDTLRKARIYLGMSPVTFLQVAYILYRCMKYLLGAPIRFLQKVYAVYRWTKRNILGAPMTVYRWMKLNILDEEPTAIPRVADTDEEVEGRWEYLGFDRQNREGFAHFFVDLPQSSLFEVHELRTKMVLINGAFARLTSLVNVFVFNRLLLPGMTPRRRAIIEEVRIAYTEMKDQYVNYQTAFEDFEVGYSILSTINIVRCFRENIKESLSQINSTRPAALDLSVFDDLFTPLCEGSQMVANLTSTWNTYVEYSRSFNKVQRTYQNHFDSIEQDFCLNINNFNILYERFVTFQ